MVVRDVLREPMLLLLIAAATVYLLLGDIGQAALLAASVAVVIGLNVRQEQRAESALQALREFSRPQARVIRDGQATTLAARNIVVGDVVLLSEGERIPADAWVIEESDLHVDESLLTGESVPVRRGVSNRLVADDRVHAGTLVVRGQGMAEVVATGAATAVGRIGASLHTIPPRRSPLQQDMRHVVMLFAGLAAVACASVAGLSFATRGDLLTATLAGLTLAIATIPEEFPMVVTVFLAIGAWRMAQRKALIRQPAAIETLGSVSVLCVDKTGTLTENRMAVAQTVTRAMTAAPGAIDRSLLEVAALASRDGSPDPMDRALRARATDGFTARKQTLHHVREYPISPRCPAMAHVWADGGHSLLVACKGAPETVADLCGLDTDERARQLEQAEDLARHGLRVLGVAERVIEGGTQQMPLPDSPAALGLEWRGLVGFADTLRPGIHDAVAQARAAGIRVLMLTGDHVETARVIARQAGIDDGGDVLQGSQIDAMDDAALGARLQRTNVCARVRPEHKLRLVERLEQGGAVVAMTGDGVNDAPALMAANVGIAMGGRGTDVAREAASIVLLDDNFVTIISAIGLGRRIYRNIRRAVAYILAVHVPIAGLAILPLVMHGPLVLLPLHVVFLELIIDPACSIVFEQEPADADAMECPPRPSAEHLLTLKRMAGSLLVGGVMFATVVATYLGARAADIADAQVGALAFTTLVIGNLSLVLVFRGGRTLWASLKREGGTFPALAVAATILLLVVTHVAPVSRWFAFEPPPPGWLAMAAALPLVVAGLIKWARNDEIRVATPASARPNNESGVL